MRRLPPTLLALLPVAAALVYAGAYAVLGPSPTTATVVPRMAVLSARFRGLEALDEHWPFDRPEHGRVSEVLGALRNVPGLKGVDRSGPVHWLLLPREARSDPTMMIFPLSDASAFRERFEGRDLPEAEARGLERHAQHLEIRGSFAGLAWDREAVRHLGEGGVTAEDRGEDVAFAVDVPAMVAYALSDAGRAPWRALVEALGAEPSKFERKVDTETGMRTLEFPSGRLPLIAEGWRTARLWAWKQRREVEVELEPADADLLSLLAAVGPVAPGETSQAAPTGALASLEVRGVAGRRALARALYLLGVKDTKDLLAADSGTAGGRAGDLILFALPNSSEGHGWTIAVCSPCGPLPDLAPALVLPALGSSRLLAEGAAPATVSDGRWDGLSPAGSVVRLALPAPSGAAPCPPGSVNVGVTPGTYDVVLVGADAASQAKGTDAWHWPAPTVASGPGPRLLARLYLRQDRARELLAGAMTDGGPFSVLAGGDLKGEVTTDGRVLRLHLTVSK